MVINLNFEKMLNITFSFLIFACLAHFDIMFMKAIFEGGKLNEKYMFVLVFENLTYIFVLTIPSINNFLRRKNSNLVHSFLDIPNVENRITFPSVTCFLGEQSLGAFLATILMHTGKAALLVYGGVIAAIYTFLMIVFSFFIVSVSLFRFVSYFRHLGVYLRLLVWCISCFITIVFFNIGLKM